MGSVFLIIVIWVSQFISEKEFMQTACQLKNSFFSNSSSRCFIKGSEEVPITSMKYPTLLLHSSIYCLVYFYCYVVYVVWFWFGMVYELTISLECGVGLLHTDGVDY